VIGSSGEGARPATRRDDLPPPAPRRSEDSAAAVLRAVLDHGPVARSSVARATRLSAASVSGIVSSLVDRRLVREVPEAAGPPGQGRPHVPLDIETDDVAVIGAHIAVPRLTVALLDLRGRVLAHHRERHGARDPASVLAALAARIDDLRRRSGAERRILGLGLATGGWVDPCTGTVVEHPFLGWREVPAGAVLAEATGLDVRVDQNSRAGPRPTRHGLSARPAFRTPRWPWPAARSRSTGCTPRRWPNRPGCEPADQRVTQDTSEVTYFSLALSCL